MATKQSSTPSLFNFLKEGLLLPTHNRKLFATVFSIIVASTCLLVLVNDLAIQPLADEIRFDAKALNSTDPSSPDFFHLIQEIQIDTRAVLLAGATYLLVAVILESAIRLVVHFAAVATYSGEQHTVGSLLGKAKQQLRGPMLTLAFAYALLIAYVLLLVAVFALLVFLMIKEYFRLFFAGLLLLVPSMIIFLAYVFFVYPLSIVVAVAEPGCYGAGAFGRAWRLMKAKRRRVSFFILVTSVLAGVVSGVHTLAKTCTLTNMALGLLLGFLYAILTSGVQLFAVCAMTAFYYECKGSTTEAPVVDYVKVSTEDQTDASLLATPPGLMSTVRI